MADGHFPDVELLRRELAALILDWAGKSVKDDPDGPMSTALTRAVGEAARSAVAEQHQALTADAADRIAEALESRSKTSGLFLWRMSPLVLGLIAVTAAALLTGAFLLGLQVGRTDDALRTAPAAATTIPIAPLAPAVDEPAPSAASKPRASTSPTSPPVRAQRSEPLPAKPAPRPQPRELGRPAPATDETSPRSTQPVGAATGTPAAPTAATKP